MVANHQNAHDFLFVASCTKRPISFMAKKELFKGPLRWILKSIKTIAVDRKCKNPQAIRQASIHLKNKRLICIFPEGTFNKTAMPLAPFKKGAVRLAIDNNVPIVPITIEIKRRQVRIDVDKPIWMKSKDYEEQTIRLRELMMKKIRGMTWN